MRGKADGAVRITADGVLYSKRRGGEWRIAVEDIAAIGEFTTTGGPLLDDYFIVLVCRDGTWRAAPFYAEGREEVLKTLGSRLGSTLVPGLCNSVELRSRVMWPPELAGHDLLVFKDRRSEGFAAAVRRLVGRGECEISLSPEVAALVAGL